MVECGECGFLALRNKRQRIWIECEEQYRENAKVSEAIWKGDADILERDYSPECFMAVAGLLSEIIENQEANNFQVINDTLLSRDSISEIIWKERECAQFTKWQQGFTPKEHREMLDRDKWLEWQEKQRKDDRRWRIIEIIVFGIIATIVAGGFTVLGAFIERGSLFP